jgi:hypothetical protein
MKIGAENKKSVYALSVLGVVAAYLVYSNFFSGPSYKPVTPQTVSVPSDASSDIAVPAPGKSSGPDISQAKSKVGKSKSKNGEFHPIYIAKKKEDRPDITRLDPTIRFDLLARAIKVPQAGGERDLFQISKTPPVKATALADANEPKVKPYAFVGPRLPPPPPPPTKIVETPPAPMVIPFKFYGTSAVHPDGKRTAYFIIPGADGDNEILMADEGDVLKKRFRIVQIGVDKVLVEDTQDKRRQPLNMEKEATQ